MRHRKKCLLIKWRCSRQQFIEQNPEAVDVGPGIHVVRTHGGLLGAHINRSTEELAETREQRLLDELALRGLGDSEVNNLHQRLVSG